MIINTVKLREDEDITLTSYIANTIENYNPEAILVIPGGGYAHVCAEREGEPIALAFAAKGYNAFVLHYSVGPKAKFPAPLIDVSLAIAHIKRNSKEYNINPDRIFVTGFSAGGHLTAMIGTMWNHEDVYKNTDIKFGENKPCGCMPIYPVITASEGECHMGSFLNLIGSENPSKEELEYFSLENRVSDETVPMFITSTATDNLVPVQSSLYLATALSKNNISFELHIYPYGPHGLALGNNVTANGNQNMINGRYSRWVDDACAWVKEMF